MTVVTELQTAIKRLEEDVQKLIEAQQAANPVQAEIDSITGQTNAIDQKIKEAGF